MHQSVEWLQPSDRIILQDVARYGGWIKPSSVYLNVEYSQAHVQRRCRELYRRGLLKRHETDTAYQISDLGREWLLGELSVNQFRRRTTD